MQIFYMYILMILCLTSTAFAEVSGKYIDNNIGGELTVVKIAKNKIAFSIYLEQGVCGGIIDETEVKIINNHAIFITEEGEQGPFEGDKCTLDIIFKGNKAIVKESGICLYYHGVSCGFTGTYEKSN